MQRCVRRCAARSGRAARIPVMAAALALAPWIAPGTARAQGVAGASAATVSDTVPGARNLARVSGGYYDRSHDYDLVHQRIELGGFDWDSLAFRGRVETEVVARAEGLDSLVLDAGHLLRIRRVSDAAGPLRTGRHGDTLVVYLPHPAAFGDTVHFTVVYDGRVENGRGLTFIRGEGPQRPRQIWSQGEGMNNHYWFPTYDFPNDKETWELVATVPAGFMAVSNGRLVARRENADGTRTFDWSQERRSATYLVSLVVAPLVKIHDSWRDVPVDYYVYPADSAKAWRVFHVTPDMIDVYSRLTGIPYAWAKYAQTTVADFFGGMENVSATTLVDWLPGPGDFQDRPWYDWLLIPHELAHMWFGDDVTTEDWANIWLNEGFAEFMPGQYWTETLGVHAGEDYYLNEYHDLLRIDARRRMPVAANGSNDIYPKGALVLKMLRDYLGPRRFWAGAHRYLEEHSLGNATTDDLRQAFLEATGENLAWFFDEWLYAAGFPEFDVTSSYDAAARRLTLHVRQVQQDTATADSTGLRYVTPRVFRMPVTVRVGTAAGDVTRRFLLDRREQDLVLDSVGAPTRVVFDAGNHILKKLSFQQPTPWLAEALERDSALWDREWAIGQLGERTAEPAAARALARAAAGADYFLTRAQAATALGGFPAATALPPLEAAMRDTSAAVRAAAVAALGQVGGPRALALAGAAFERDSSTTVRAAAVAAVARADHDTARVAALLRQALATPSYREAIRNAALVAIARGGLTAFTPEIEPLLGGENSIAADVLAALAQRGDPRALQMLVAHLDDPRRTVRQAVVRALGQLPTSLTREPIRGALPGVRDPETRRALEQLLKRAEPTPGR